MHLNSTTYWLLLSLVLVWSTSDWELGLRDSWVSSDEVPLLSDSGPETDSFDCCSCWNKNEISCIPASATVVVLTSESLPPSLNRGKCLASIQLCLLKKSSWSDWAGLDGQWIYLRRGKAPHMSACMCALGFSPKKKKGPMQWSIKGVKLETCNKYQW